MIMCFVESSSKPITDQRIVELTACGIHIRQFFDGYTKNIC